MTGLLPFSSARQRWGNGLSEIQSGTGNITLTVGSNAQFIRATGTFNAVATWTPGTVNAYPGANFLITRTGPGTGALQLGALRAIGTGTWALLAYEGTNASWYVAAAGQT